MRDGGGGEGTEHQNRGGLKDFKAGETDLDLLITWNMSLSHIIKPMKTFSVTVNYDGGGNPVEKLKSAVCVSWKITYCVSLINDQPDQPSS